MFHIYLNDFTYLSCIFNVKVEIFFSCIKFSYINLDYGSQLDPKQVTVNKLIKLVLSVSDLIRILVIC